jgi:SAM-dependent methyltransferase
VILVIETINFVYEQRSMKKLIRNKCVLFGDELEKLYSFKNFPIFMGCTDEDISKDILIDMNWFIGKKNGFIQLKELIPLEILYAESHGAGEIGNTWDIHHIKFAKFINKFSPNEVFEIGGGHGKLAKNYQQLDMIQWTILEPNPKPIEGCFATFINGFFANEINLDFNFDTIVHSHVLEHIYDLKIFMEKISKISKIGNRLIFSLPNMKEMLLRNYTNCLNFEHTFFITEPYIEKILADHGFEVEEKNYFMADHSIFYSAIKTDSILDYAFPDNQYEINKNIFNNFIQHHTNEIKKIKNQLNPDYDIFLFGAHIFSQYLLSFGLDQNRVKNILDNNKNKQKRRLYGTKLYVESPNCLKNLSSPQVILKAGIYNEEIKKDIIKNINSSTIFIE